MLAATIPEQVMIKYIHVYVKFNVLAADLRGQNKCIEKKRHRQQFGMPT